MAAPTHPQAMTRMGTPTAVHHEDAGTKYRSTANATGGDDEERERDRRYRRTDGSALERQVHDLAACLALSGGDLRDGQCLLAAPQLDETEGHFARNLGGLGMQGYTGRGLGGAGRGQ